MSTQAGHENLFMTSGRHRLRLVRARMLSPSVRALTFDAGAQALPYRSGQWVNLFVTTSSGLVMRRPYSIASAPAHVGPNQLDFAVTRVKDGKTSQALHELPEGAVVGSGIAEGGWLGRRDSERGLAALFVATGSGLAPFRGILQQELADSSGPPIALLFGCRTEADILWREELQSWAHDRGRFSLHVTLSQPGHAWKGATGYVQHHVRSITRNARPDLVLLCGLTPMVGAVEQALVGEGLDPACIRSEAFDR